MSGGDVHVITGMDAIINPDNIKPGIDLKELERRMISGGLIQQKIKDPQDRFNDELSDAAKKLGISFGEFTKDKRGGSGGNSSNANSSFSNIPQRLPSISLDSAFSSGSGINARRSPPEEPSHETGNNDTDSEPDDDSDDDVDDGESNPIPSPIKSYENPRSPQGGFNRFSSDERPRFGADLKSRTQEQERRSHIDSIMGGNDGNTFSFEKEKREDMKCAMLAEIDSLMSSLADDDIDLSRIPKVDRNSEFGEVESILKMLRHKNDHTRYCSFAEEFLLFGAYALEELFDGKRTWFNRYQPDLTGWHNHVNVKLKRMRHDTGQLVSGVMQDYNIGPGARVLLELVPNMVLYSKMRKQQHNMPGLFSDEEMQNVSQNIRNLSN